jgi:hypothetical protein
MTGKRRSKSQLTRDRKRVAELYLKGRLQVEIAEELGVDQSTISRDIDYLIDEWQADSINAIDIALGRELAKINLLEETYWTEWQTSKEPNARVDPRFLQGVQWCVNRRIKLLGLDGPVRKEITGKDGGPIETIDLSDLSDDQLRRLAAGEDIAAILANE